MIGGGKVLLGFELKTSHLQKALYHLRHASSSGMIYFSSCFQWVQLHDCLTLWAWVFMVAGECDRGGFHFMTGIRESKSGARELGITFKGMPHLLRFLQPPKVAPPAVDHIQHLSLLGTFHIQTITPFSHCQWWHLVSYTIKDLLFTDFWSSVPWRKVIPRPL
jgi:hypothetical protein